MISTAELGPGALCVAVTDELDYEQAYRFDREVQRLETDALETLVVDLRAVTFVDSAGLARIIAARRRAQRAGRRFAVVRGCKALDRVLALTALDDQLNLVNDPRDALV